MTADIEQIKKKIIYRSNYRGTKEMDKLLGAFTNKYLDQLNVEDLNELIKFLEIDDNNLYNFYNGLKRILNLRITKLIIYLEILNINNFMAERLGFEPRKELPLCRFSRPVLSTAQPSLREHGFISIIFNFN